jgi:hypothetical protein
VKEINRELLNAKMQDMQGLISDAMRIERILQSGETPESVSTKAREFLGLESSVSIVENAEARAKDINLASASLIQLNGIRTKLKGTISESEDASLAKVEEVLANKIIAVYGLDLEDLYLGEE